MTFTAPARLRSALLLALLALAAPARAASDAEVIRGFNATVFGAEFAGLGLPADYVRKFTGPVRFHVDDRSSQRRGPAVRRFIASLGGRIGGLRTRVVERPAAASFRVLIVDRRDYAATLQGEVAGAPVRGRCIVRSVFSRLGIARSVAVIVGDEGEALFQRCMVEEILQGLGPLNEDRTLAESMFNDASRHTRMTEFDRLILSMLYDPRIRVGASRASVQPLLPAVLRAARRR